MQTVQMTLDEDLVAEIDAAEQRHREGYHRHPVQPDEFGDWEDEQIWIE